MHAQAGREDLRSIINDLGFYPLNSRTSEFQLKDTRGGDFDFEQLRGKWTFLVFWATWCGACKGEMPILETLHVGFAPKGLKVLAVSIDEGPIDIVTKYAKDNDLTYQILLDPQSVAASKYQAQSIPTTYLISPNLRLAGITRGAVNWETQEKLKLVDKLLEFDSLQPEEKDQGLTLPENLTPPAIDLVVDENQLIVDREQTVTVSVNWRGRADQYLIKVPKLELPESVTQQSVSSSTDSKNGRSVLNYHFQLTPTKSGKVLFGPVELSYRHRNGGKELFTRISSRELEVRQAGFAHMTSLMAIMAAVVFFGGLGVIVVKRASKAHKVATANLQVPINDLERKIQAIKHLRISGQSRDYSEQLLLLVSQVFPNEVSDIDKQLEGIRYGGMTLPENQSRRFENLVENYFKNNIENDHG